MTNTKLPLFILVLSLISVSFHSLTICFIFEQIIIFAMSWTTKFATK